MIYAGDLQVQPFVAVRLESVDLLQDRASCLVRIAGKIGAVDGELELVGGHCNGQLELLFDDEWETTVSFLSEPTGKYKNISQNAKISFLMLIHLHDTLVVRIPHNHLFAKPWVKVQRLPPSITDGKTNDERSLMMS